MKISDALSSARYVVDPNGNKTDVLIPVETWKKILLAWSQLVCLLEDQDDRAIVQEWLKNRAAGEAETISLDALEKELIADGLLPR
ncbi:MAG: hypothetical protein L0Z70_17120 [Chloroflexi bacterium]|nr:hypothetical protein [Chloroflexota bacterium]